MDSPHPTDRMLSSFGLGKLDDAAAEAVQGHLEACAACRARVAAVSSDSFLDQLRGARGQSQTGAMPDGQARRGAGPPAIETLPPGLADNPDYEIKRELGRGGMGVVYLAHNRLMGRDEVLKVMGRQIMDRPNVLDRFLREIRAVARLRHPNIVTAYSATRIGESIVFAMEYVEGLDLAKLVRAKGPLPVAHACNFIHQAALGLQHAHEEGLVHRDIKPANLMLSRRGEKAAIKVLDFGLARAASEQPVEGALTHAGQALGTPDFIAPEQITDAANADIRADIYSLGGTLYYLLAGGPPFREKSLYDTYQAHISRNAEPLNLVRPEVPSELAALVAKMMAKEPRRRFQTPGEVAVALAPFFRKGQAPPRVSQREAPRVERPTPRSEVPPTEVAPSAARPDAPRESPAERTVPETPWEDVIDVRGDEASPTDSRPVAAPARRPPWLGPALGVGVVMLGLFVALAAGVFRVATPEGDLVFSGLPEGGLVSVDGRVARVEWPGGDGPAKVSVAEGEHRVKVELKGVEVYGTDVKIAAGEKKWVRVQFEPRDAEEKADGDAAAPGPIVEAMTRTPSGLRYQDIAEGTGLTPEAGQTCAVHYTGWFWQDGRKGKEFDSSLPRGNVFEFPIGKGKVIKGWDEGVATMRVGGKRRLLVPPELAYGSRGAGGAIPPDATLLFEIELFAVKPAESERQPPGGVASPPADRAPVASRPGPPEDAKPFEGRRYKVFPEFLSWHQARDRCKALGGRLAIVGSDRENRFITSLLHEADVKSAWLGATDEVVEGRWVWVDGSEMRFEKWDRGADQPNNHAPWGEVEHYLVMDGGRDGVWWDYVDFDARWFRPGYVCQWGEGEADASNPDGFVSIFNGKDLAGWTVDRGDPGSWRVLDGHLVANATGDYRNQSFLLSTRTYSDFILRFDVWLPPGTDSGVAIRAAAGDAPSPPELNLRNNPEDPPGSHAQTGALRWSKSGRGTDYLPPKRTDLLRGGASWNEMAIVVEGGTIHATLNGQVVQHADLDGFSNRPDALPFLKRRSGRVGFQCHTGHVRFRNIEIKELNGKATSVAGRPPADAVAHRRSHFKTFAGRLTWHEAKSKCEEMGGRLAVVTSEEENRLLTALARSAGVEGAWLGATDVVTEGKWVWVDGSPMTYANWDRDGLQPNNKQGVEHYLVLQARREGRWSDQPDALTDRFLIDRAGFVCEWP